MNEIFKDLPCIRASCLKFPACKHKRRVRCNSLTKWVKYARPSYEIIREVFTNLDVITVETRQIRGWDKWLV